MYKNTTALVLLLMPRSSEHERSGAIGMLKAGVRVSDFVRYHKWHPSTIQRLRDRYQATGTVKDRRRSCQPRMATVVKSQHTSIMYRRYPFRPATVSARRITDMKMSHALATLNFNNFVVYGQKHKVWVLVFLVNRAEHFETKTEQIWWNFLFCRKTASSTATPLKKRWWVFHQKGWVIKQLFHACL